MYLDFKKLFSDAEDQQRFTLTFSFEGGSLPSGAVFTGPVNIQLDTLREGSAVKCVFQCSALCRAECARCLAPFTSPLSAQRVFYLKEQDLSNEEELPVTAQGLDVKELAWQELLLAAPMVLHCSEDCEGLCPVCGKPKKLGCTCGTTAVDERLQILKQLLQ